MSKATLVVLAAGLGSRYGGAKQIDPVDSQGHTIIDYSVYDAIRAGFDRIVFVVRPEMEDDVRDVVGRNAERKAEVFYAHQTLDMLPDGFSIPEGRKKPWGTGHATLCALKYVDSPFSVINADDFYGRHAYKALFDYITTHGPDEHCMVGYRLKNTVTDNGYVSRGICSVSDQSDLLSVEEILHIEKTEKGIEYTENGTDYIPLDPDTFVSLNTWGFGTGMRDKLERYFVSFLENLKDADPVKSEYFLPGVVESVLAHGEGSVKLLPSEDRWFGVTYREDKDEVSRSIDELKIQGIYPERLWD